MLDHRKSKIIPEKASIYAPLITLMSFIVDYNKLWKILKEMGLPDHLTCLLRNLYIGQEATVRTRHQTTGWFQTGQGVHQGCILSPCLFNLYTEYIRWNAGLDEAQAEIKIARRNINNLRYADDTTLTTESKEELKSLLMKVRGEWKSWLEAQHSENEDHGVWSHHFMANRWGNGGNSVNFIFWGSKIPADCDWSHEIKRHLLPRQHIKKQRHYFVNKGPSSQGYGFSSSHVWMDVRIGLWRRLSAEELMLLNCGVGEDSWESLGQQGDPSPF